MGYPVKCCFCGERFDRDFEPFIKVNTKRYAHECCATKAKKRMLEISDAAITLKMVPLLVLKKRRKR